MVSYGLEHFRHPDRWTPEEYDDYLKFQALAQIEADERKKQGK